MSEELLIRADATVASGTGHVMRCIALAQAWDKAGGRAIVAQAQTTPAVTRRLEAEGFGPLPLDVDPGSVADAQETCRLAHERSASWVIADGYHFGGDYQQELKRAGLRLLLLDDFGHAEHYCADYVLNQNLSAAKELYANRAPYTRLLLGTRYALLRRGFEAWRNWQREIPPLARNILVTLGGSDSANATALVIGVLQRRAFDHLKCVVLVGGSNPHLDELRRLLATSPRHVELVVDEHEVPARMARADIAITAGGSTCWEAAFMGLPSLVIVLAENQQAIAAALEQEGVANLVGTNHHTNAEALADALLKLCSSVEQRSEMSRRGRVLVDGEGSDRVVATLRHASASFTGRVMENA